MNTEPLPQFGDRAIEKLPREAGVMAAFLVAGEHDETE